MPPNDEGDSNKNMEQLDELKKIIRSIVIPYKNGAKVGKLMNDYKDIEGRDIPYKELGYRSLNNLLQAMPDVVKFQYNENNDYVLFPIMNEETEHIQVMVREQKKAPNMTRRSNCTSRLMAINRNRSNFSNRHPPTPFPPPAVPRFNSPLIPFATMRPQYFSNQIPFSMNQSFIPLFGNHFGNHRQELQNFKPSSSVQSNNDAIPSSIQRNISIMLEKFQCGLPLKDFNLFYDHHFKCSLNYDSYGFDSLATFLKSLSNICFVTEDGMVHSRKQSTVTAVSNAVSFQVAPNMSRVRTRPTITRTTGHTNANVKVTAASTSVTVTTQKSSITISSTTVTTTVTTAVTRTKPSVQCTSITKENYDWNSWLQAKDAESEKNVTAIRNSDKVSMKTDKTCKSETANSDASRQVSMLITVENKKSGKGSRVVTNCDNNTESDNTQKLKRSVSVAAIKKLSTSNLWPTLNNQAPSTTANLKPAGSQVLLMEPTPNIAECKSRSKVEEWLRKNETLKKGNEDLFQGAEAHVTPSELRLSTNPINNTDKFPAQVIAAFKRLIAKHPSGIPVTDFVRQYEREELGFEMNSLQWGFATPIQVFYALPSIFAITPPDLANEMMFAGSESDHILYDANNIPREVEDLLRSGVTRKKRIPSGVQVPVGGIIDDKVKFRVLKLLQIMTEGITIADFPSIYQLNFRESIYPERWRYESFYDFFCALSFELPLSVRAGSEPKVFLESQLFADWFKLCISEQRHSALRIFVDYPDDAVFPGETIDPIDIPEDFIMKENNQQLSWIPTLITSAMNPTSFWVHIQGSNFSDSVTKLMRDLEFYDSPESEKYRVPDEFVIRGLFCAARFPGDNQWHRVKISRLQSSGRVTVFYIDYGGLAILDRKDLRLLKRQFFPLKQQAIHVSLRGIKPALMDDCDRWSLRSRELLLEFSNRDYWLATLFYPKISAGKYEVIICDTNTENDVFLHNVLVEAKVAVRHNSDITSQKEVRNSSTSSVTPITPTLWQKIKQMAKESKTKHLDSLKKDLKNKSFSTELRDILEMERKLECNDWDVNDSAMNLYSSNDAPSPASTTTLFSSQQKFTGNEDVISLGRIICNNSIVINIFSIDHEIFVLASQIDSLLKDSPVWKYIAETSFEIEEIILNDKKEELLNRISLSNYAIPGVKLYKIKGVLDKLKELNRINEKSQFQCFFKKYASKYSGTSDPKKRRLLQSIESLTN